MGVRLGGQSFAGVGVVPQVRKGLWHRDDFINTLLSSWSVNGGAATIVGIDSESGVPGIVRQSVSAVAENSRVLGDATYMNTLLAAGHAKLYFEARGRITTLSDGTNDIAVRVGFGDTPNSDQADGIYFENNRNVHGNNQWRACCAANSVRTKTDTGVAPTAATWFRLRMELVGGVASFMIDGAPVASVSTNIPSGAGRTFTYLAATVKALGAAARTVDWDYIEIGATFSTER